MKRRSLPDEARAAPPAGRARRALRFAWRWMLRPVLALVVLILALVWGERAIHAIRSAGLSEAERLSEDLSRLERVLLREHPAPFRNAPRPAVQQALDRARAAIARYGAGEILREGVVASLAEVVASLRDPHTSLAGRYDHFGILRVSFTLFGDDVRLRAAPDADDLGARVLAFDGVPAAEVLDRIRPMVAAPNPSAFLDGAPAVLRSPGLLHHLGVAAEPTRVTLRLERLDGSQVDLSLPRVTLDEYRQSRPASHDFAQEELPLYRQKGRGTYWLETLTDHRAVYLRCTLQAEFADAELAALAERLLEARAELGPGPVVVDLRGNPGGNPQAHIPLVAALASSAATRGPEKLRVLVDRGTYSAAIVAAADLERRAGALVVGEEPGDNAHLTTDARPFTLRHTGAVVWVPNGPMHTAGGAGGRSRLIPDRQVAPTFEEWLAGRDPALDAALASWQPSEPAAGGPAAPLPGGRFAFDDQRTLTLTANSDAHSASVTGLGSDVLAQRPDGVWTGGIHRGLRATPDGGLEALLPGGEWAALPRRPAPAPLELALEGREAEAARAYGEVTSAGAERLAVAALALPSEGFYRYHEGQARQGRILLDLARLLSPADPLIPLQHSLLRKEAEGRWIPPAGEVLHALAACGRRYARAEVLNDMRLCL